MKSSRKVLIAEDSGIQADVLEGLLNDFGMNNVEKTVDGLGAMECFERELLNKTTYSLVFLDIVMPRMDGQEALKRMRELEKNHGVPEAEKSIIIMTTALDSPMDMMDALISGNCSDYIVKPVEEDNLRTMLSKYKFID